MARFYKTTDATGVKKIFSPGIAREVEKDVYFHDCIGEGKNAMIRNIGGFDRGDNNTYQLRYIPEDDGVTENQTLRGNETALNYATDNISINELAFASSSENVMTPQRFPWDPTVEMAAECSEKMVRRFDQVMFRHLCGFTPINDYASDIVNQHRGNNAITDASAGRYIPASGTLSDTDVSLTSAHTFNRLELIDWAIEAATAPDTDIPPMRPIGGPNGQDGIRWKLFLHPYCVTDFVTAVSSSEVTWSDIALAEIQGGKTDRNKYSAWMIGKYKDVGIYSAYYVTNGVSATANTELTNVKRNVFCGAGAGTLGFGKGFGFGTKKKPGNFKTVPVVDDYEREYNIGCSVVYGFKKARFSKDGTAFDFGSIVIPAWGASHH